MNKQRLQAYYHLIESLLNCHNGEKPDILAANTELLDAGFLRVLKPAIEYYSQQGDNNAASFLRDLDIKLSAALNSSPEDIETYRQFLQEILQATAESNGDAQVIYPLLAVNTDKLNHIFAEQLRFWAINILAETESDAAAYIAAVIGELSNLIQQFPLGSKANNMEIAIAGCEIILTVYTRSAFPEQWAKTQNNLGNAYRERIRGDKAENIEQAIAAFSAALQIRTRVANPQDWAITQQNLGNAYFERIRGDKAENIEQAIAAFSAALQIRTRVANPQDWAITQQNLANAYLYRIKGNKAENLEQAIAAYSAALQILTRVASPHVWAMTQSNLGVAYFERIKGNKAENIEQAIAAFSDALQILTRVANLHVWAITQKNLGLAYKDRIRGDKAENIEQAIAAYSAALEVLTRADFPKDWAGTQDDLGFAYTERIRGDKAENIEQAIAACSAALQVRTRVANPQDWGGTQNNLAAAYFKRIRGDKAENLEQAIAAFSAALEVYTPIANPYVWARGQNNLAAAYCERIRGDKEENLEQAIAAYSAALEVLTRDDFPQYWATTQTNLGLAYIDRIRGDQAENLETAITASTAALEVLTRDDFPQYWATTQTNLGLAYQHWARVQNNLRTAYQDRIRGDKEENLEQAIAAFSAALEVRTRADFPQDWATTQNNLGNAYRERIRGDEAENLKQAIAAFSAALEVCTRTNFPERNVLILSNLGLTYQDTQQFNLAYESFTDAIQGVEGLREEVLSGDETKRKQSERWNRNYIGMVEVCLKLGNFIEAIEYVERSKTRNLVESILNRDLKTIFPSEVVTQLEQLRDEIASGQYQIQNGKAENTQALAQHLQELRQQRNELQDRYLPVGSSFNFEQFHSNLDTNTAIIEWYITPRSIIAFVIKPKDEEITVWQSQQKDLDALINWNDEYISDYYEQKDQWQNKLEERLKKLSEILHLEEILTNIPKDCDRLILIPHRFLHLFPLHALPVKESYLIDLFPNGVGYAPSCQLLQQVQIRQIPDFQSFFAIQNPTEDLYEKDLGAVAAIKKQFTNPQILKQDQAKKSAILCINEKPHSVALNEQFIEANCAFFFCHGYFNRSSPLDSGLLLSDCFVSSELAKVDSKRYMPVPGDEDKAVDLTKCLTLADIITHVKLEHCRLVTLSACETGVIDSKNISDEYIGLPSGFLLAGSTNVVSSLWTVDATATALLMIKFYEELQQQSNIILALNTAQRWLRNTPVQKFRAWLKESNLDEDWQDELDEQFEQIEKHEGSKTEIFASPFYWSAFCAIGKGV